MLNWFKNLFSDPKKIIKLAVDSLDLAVPYLASEIDSVKGKAFDQMSSTQKAQFIVDRIQLFLRGTFHLDI